MEIPTNTFILKGLNLIKNKRVVKDPPRFPNVINGYESLSVNDFRKSLELELGQLSSILLNK